MDSQDVSDAYSSNIFILVSSNEMNILSKDIVKEVEETAGTIASTFPVQANR